jgi:hypothetical protein
LSYSTSHGNVASNRYVEDSVEEAESNREVEDSSEEVVVINLRGEGSSTMHLSTSPDC